MARFRAGKIHVNNNLQKNPEREKYALFTKPYIEIPNVIVVRKDNNKQLTLDQMQGMKRAVTKNFAIHNHIQTNFDDLELIPQPNDNACLLETSTRDVDAAVVNLAVASYIIEKQGITNLHVAGYADYANRLSFASIKEWPLLNQILDKGLAQISQTEKAAIYRRWISLGNRPFYQSRTFWIVSGGGLVIAAAFLLLTLVWNKSLKRQIARRTETLEKTNAQLKQEIEQRNRIQAALEESKKFVSGSLNGLSAHIALLDETGQIVLVNHAWRRFAADNGISADRVSEVVNYLQVCDRSVGENAEEAVQFANGIRSVLCGQQNAYQLEYSCHSPEGKRWFVGRVTRFPGADSRHVVIAHENITQRKQAEHSLVNSEKKYRAILESMEDPTYICSSDLKIEYMNPAMVKLLGEDATGQICYATIFGFDQRCPHCVYSRMLQGKKDNAHISVELKNKIFHVSNSPIDHANGRMSKLTVYRDITETKRMETRLQQAHKMEAIGTLAGGIAHDFNNILFPIVGHTEMLLEDFPENNSLRDSLNEIYSGAMRARDLVKQILTFSRQEKNELKLMKLQPIVKEALKMIRSTIPTTISIHQNLEASCGAVKANPTHIHQIVMNLATNAYHAMEESGGV
jgi:PAS domain S-box-containing protein